MVAASIGCGVGAFFVNDDKKKQKLLKGALCLYAGQLVESIFSNSFYLLTNQKKPEEAKQVLSTYRALEPTVQISITNYHYETESVKEKEYNFVTKKYDTVYR